MKTEKKVNILVITIIIVLVIGIISLVIYQKYKYSDVYFNYNGFDVQKMNTKNGVFYYIKMFLNDNPQPVVISTRYDPRTLENISVEGDIKDSIMKKELYISFDKKAKGLSVIAGMEISKITGNPSLYNIHTQGAMIEDISGKNVTVKTCNNVNTETGIIWLKSGNETKVYNKLGCIVIEGSDEYELIRGADRFILTLLEIMKP